MSISKYAKRKALEYASRAYKIAHPDANLESGSAIRAIMLLPFSFIYSSVFEDMDEFKNMHLGNFSSITQNSMDILASNLLQSRPKGSKATTTLRLYLNEAEPFSLESFPYFRSTSNVKYSPIRPMSYGVQDVLEDNGELYVNVTVMAEIFGPRGTAGAGEINEFESIPIDISRVTNPDATIGGDPRFNNEGFFNYLRSSFNDGTTAQESGVRKLLADDFIGIEEIGVVDPRSPMMLRDEIWSSDGTHPNLDRKGKPFAAHQNIGDINFDEIYGRATGAFTSDMVNKRISIEGDIESFRTIIDVPKDGQAIISGNVLEGIKSAEVWGSAPHIGGKSDVYLHIPSVEIQSTIIDKSEETEVLSVSQEAGFGRIFYPSDDINLTKGVVVYQQGGEDEQVFDLISRGSNDDEFYLDVDGDVSNLNPKGLITVYDMSEVVIGEDILNVPVLYVLRVDSLDPLSFEINETIPKTNPGDYDRPGWYISNSDPAQVFSAKENKKIILDSKKDSNSFKPISLSSVSLTSSNSLNRIDGGFSRMEGREINLSSNKRYLQRGTVVDQEVTVDGNELTLTNYFIEYKDSEGGRDDFFVILKDSGTIIDIIHTVSGKGAVIENTSGVFDVNTTHVDIHFPHIQGLDGVSSVDDVFPLDGSAYIEGDDYYIFDGSDWILTSPAPNDLPYIDEVDIESIVLKVIDDSNVEVIADLDFIINSNTTPLAKLDGSFTVAAEDATGDFNSNPIRVIYATNSTFGEIQREIDESGSRLLCDDTLTRSMLPSIIDAEVSFSGNATSEELYSSFINLIQQAVKEVDDGERIRIDISTIVSALDDGGLTSSMDVNFEVKVTNYLLDGEYIVKYINPSERTKQALAVSEEVTAGDDRLILRRVDSTSQIPGRGKLILGGNNPDTQEIIPYEAVVEQSNGTYKFLLRENWLTNHPHPVWETAYVAVRDYDPRLEFREGAIFIPPNNRPYVRQLVVTKR